MTRWLVTGTLMVLLASPAGAQTAGDKLVRGFAGMTAAFLEVPGNMVRETDRHGAGVGIPLGFAKGLGMIVPRVLVGVFETITSPFPVPAGYQPILEPEFPWSYFEERAAAPPRR